VLKRLRCRWDNWPCGEQTAAVKGSSGVLGAFGEGSEDLTRIFAVKEGVWLDRQP
jgi:hypothetical protein